MILEVIVKVNGVETVWNFPSDTTIETINMTLEHIGGRPNDRK